MIKNIKTLWIMWRCATSLWDAKSLFIKRDVEVAEFACLTINEELSLGGK
jgi:hypothetical protein